MKNLTIQWIKIDTLLSPTNNKIYDRRKKLLTEYLSNSYIY